jgi:hypothetical protein
VKERQLADGRGRRGKEPIHATASLVLCNTLNTLCDKGTFVVQYNIPACSLCRADRDTVSLLAGSLLQMEPTNEIGSKVKCNRFKTELLLYSNLKANFNFAQRKEFTSLTIPRSYKKNF